MSKTLQGETIIYFGPEPWEGLWRNRHQLMTRLAKRNNVWYVEPATTLRTFARDRKQRTRLFTRDASGVGVFHSPWWLPIIGRAPIKNLSLRLFMSVLCLITQSGKRAPIVWYAKPEMLDYVDALAARLTIYHVVDEYSGYGTPSEKQQQKVLTQEIALLRKADLAIVVTPTLLERKIQYNPNTVLVPNAVDFSAYADCGAEIPERMRHISGPIIGYTGLIAARLDLQLLLAVSIAQPGWSFAFVGAVNDRGCTAELARLRERPNVHFLGEKPVFETPQYVSQFDVCMIPYLLNLRAEHASPLKLYEYAAASKPIVTTDFPAARVFKGHVEIVDDCESFVAACKRCLDAEAIAGGIADNLRFAENNTWDHRVAQVAEVVRTHLDS